MALPVSQRMPSPLEAFAFRVVSKWTAIEVGTPKPRRYSSRTSVPGHLGAYDDREIIADFNAFLDDIEAVRVGETAPCFMSGMTDSTTLVFVCPA